jgi:hypothetical protein
MRKRIFLLLVLLVFIGFCHLPRRSFAEGKIGKSLGIYIYESIEGFHSVSSAAGTRLASTLKPFFNKVQSFDKIPLESNESVRILEEMTKDRKIVITAISTWLSGGVIAAPTVTFADDDIKFRDLTWHVNQDAVMKDADDKDMSHVLIGSFSGMIKAAAKQADSRGKLLSVTVIANLRLIEAGGGTTLWADTYREVRAGFDPRVVFDEVVEEISKKAGRDAIDRMSQHN